MLSVIQNSLTEIEKQWFFNELEDCKLEPHELFGQLDAFPLKKHVFLLDTDSPCSSEIFYNVPHTETIIKSNTPLFTFGVDNATDDFVLPNISGLDSI